MNKAEALAKYFPYIDEFREMQEPAIDHLLTGESILCLMPTGGGKSLIFQVAGICMEKTVLVISPLVALMNQHHNVMITAGLSSINFSGMDYEKQYKALTSFASKLPQFIFSSPERISSDGYFEYILKLRRDNIGLVVVDEVHCVSQWGDGFRPSYRDIPAFLNNIFGPTGWPPVLCLTATLNVKEQTQIEHEFHITHTLKSANIWRENLHLEIINLKSGKEESKHEALISLLEKHKGQKILVFVHRKYGKKGTTRTIADELQGKYEGIDYFDADISDSKKTEVLEGFKIGALKIVLATSAFGMGVDIPDIRVVINYLISESVEQYYQEVGRAGRDGQDAYGYLLYTSQSKAGRLALLRKSLCTRKELLEEYEGRKILTGEAFRSIPIMDMTEEQRIAFSLLSDNGIIKIVAKGLQSISCFVPITTEGKAFLSEMENHSKIGSTKLISIKAGVTISALTDQIWRMCCAGHLQLKKSPIKAIFYTTVPELTEDVIQNIMNDQEAKKRTRQLKFEKFVEGIELSNSIENIVRESLNI